MEKLYPITYQINYTIGIKIKMKCDKTVDLKISDAIDNKLFDIRNEIDDIVENQVYHNINFDLKYVLFPKYIN